MQQHTPLLRECLGEAVGTFFLVFFGTGAVFVAALTGALAGLLEVTLVFGLGISLAIYAVSAISGAHLNPAVTVAVAAFRAFPAAKIVPYVISQVVGAFLASALLYAIFAGVVKGYEQDKGLVRGQPGSERVAMIFGEYFPNPAAFGTRSSDFARCSELQAMLAEGVGTAVLVFFIFALTDPRNRNRPDGTFFALYIGLAVTVIISLFAPLTQAGINPARDFGPRLFAYCAGWGRIAIPGPRGGFFSVYILSPIVGGIVGGLLYDLLIRPRVAPVTASPTRAADLAEVTTETTVE